ncbi:Flap endonuclease GEN 1 [Hypsizygus marmoreus]|uniref:Flap endonuclease GEN 1 n=1 Tax=Hypsizygus marmoreus TaxID=39966 RepID=A0A369JCE3_HYPMA|nr:Flap endonuclease GEN 1 [Hypsizygus marmoreus]
MGIQDFWKHVEKAGQPTSLTNLAIEEGFKVDRRNTSTILVGIDTSLWYSQCQTEFQHPGLHAQRRENPELRALFYRLAALLRLPITPVFVFDGGKRPPYKRWKTAKYRPIWYSGHFEKMIRAFGFHCHTAPGDAEAELALLNQKGFIDAVLTEDNNAFLFGARFVIRVAARNYTTAVNAHDGGLDAVEVYSAQNILSKALLSQAGMLLVAVLRGGDYDEIGLRGCGSEVAFALARAPLAKSLHDAAISMSLPQLRRFLELWRSDLFKELSVDLHGYLGREYHALAHAIPPDFPDPETVQLYAKPSTSWSGSSVEPQIPVWSPQLPDLPTLAALCETYFSWGHEICTRLSAQIWTGYCTRQLIWLRKSPPHPEHPFRLENIIRINKSKLQRTAASPYKSYRLEMNLVSSLNTAVSGLGSTHPAPRGISTGWLVTMWIPATIVERIVDHLVPEEMQQQDRVLTTWVTLLDPPILAPVPISLGTFDLTLADDEEDIPTTDFDANTEMPGLRSVIDLTAADSAGVEVIDLTSM